MKRCKICHVEAELEDGRCHSCRMAKEATDHGMTYGKYAVTLIPVVLPVKPKKKKQTKTKVCPVCGKEFSKANARVYCSYECYQKQNYIAHRKRLEATGSGCKRFERTEVPGVWKDVHAEAARHDLLQP